MTNVLQICQDAADVTATQRPVDLFDKNMLSNAIFLSVLKNELDSLMRYGDWQMLLKEGSFKPIKDKNFYFFDEIVPDFYALVHNTIYVKNQNEEIIGALTPQEWMKNQNLSAASGDIQFKIENNGFKFLGDVPENVEIVFMYRSNAVCYDSKTFEMKSELSKNTDVPVFDKYVVKLGVIWRWLKRNGMDYEEEYNEYQKELKKKFGLGLSVRDIKLANAFLPENECGCVVEHVKGC